MRVERIEWDGADATACAAQVRALVPGLEKVTREVGEVIVAVGAHGDQAVRDLGGPLRRGPGRRACASTRG